ncbi:MAG TPA: LysM peptidoglycan-binding domain-containing protein, partial [Alphaproteobacteria bacterium]|nr:LysM peptidoglycan-binding domain-containing protein [Alphaproteobacteria bacterium]
EELLLGDALVVVQPGNSLWRIARRAYGGGVYYTEIYGANRAQILDPDMIFPGQILALPVLN